MINVVLLTSIDNTEEEEGSFDMKQTIKNAIKTCYSMLKHYQTMS